MFTTFFIVRGIFESCFIVGCFFCGRKALDKTMNLAALIFLILHFSFRGGYSGFYCLENGLDWRNPNELPKEMTTEQVFRARITIYATLGGIGTIFMIVPFILRIGYLRYK
uniref:Uncharacterized protein n=1 Tax=Panagrolaimus sp. JU765 TaxID=591449 RepID=A0AC34QCP4_9BILA